MIDKDSYDLVKKEFKATSSWCIWKEPNANDNNKNSNISDMTWVPNEDNTEKFNEFLSKINTGVVFIGLNPSSKGKVKSEWGSFHVGMYDYRLREALCGTDYWGSYITDLFKDVRNGNGSNVNPNGAVVEKAIKKLEKELKILANDDVQSIRFLVALGTKVYDYLTAYQNDHPAEEFSKYIIVKLKHYSTRYNRGGYTADGSYKDEVKDVLSVSEKIVNGYCVNSDYKSVEIKVRTNKNNKFTIMVNAPLMGNAEKATL